MDNRDYDEGKFLSDHTIEALLIKLNYQHSEMKALCKDSRTTSMVLKHFYNKVQRSMLERECQITFSEPLKSNMSSNHNFESCLHYIDLVNEWDQKLFEVEIKVKTLQNEFYKICEERTKEVKRRATATIAREQLKFLSNMRSKSPEMRDICFVIWKSAVMFRKRKRSPSSRWTVPNALESLIRAETDEDVPKPKSIQKRKRMFKKGRFPS